MYMYTYIYIYIYIRGGQREKAAETFREGDGTVGSLLQIRVPTPHGTAKGVEKRRLGREEGVGSREGGGL